MANCILVRASGTDVGKQGTVYRQGVSAESVGSRAICMHLLTVPPGGKAKPHLHAGHESTIYVLSGQGGMWFGEGLREHMDCKPGDFIYIPAGVPHQPYNSSATEPLVGIAARTDPHEQESVVLLPEFDGVH